MFFDIIHMLKIYLLYLAYNVRLSKCNYINLIKEVVSMSTKYVYML